MEKIEYFCDSDMRNMKQSIKILCWVSLVMVMLSAQMTSAAKELTTLYLNFGSFTWQTTGDPKIDGVFVGEVRNGVPHGKGPEPYPNGKKIVGEFKDDKPWNVTVYDKDGNVEGTASNGVPKAR